MPISSFKIILKNKKRKKLNGKFKFKNNKKLFLEINSKFNKNS